MDDISRETLKRIKEQKIVPRPKGYFLLKKSSVWFLFVLAVVSGSVAAGAAIFQINNTEWYLFPHYRHSILEFVLLFIPYLWGLFLIFFAVVAYYYFRKTQTGYRYRAATIVAITVILSILGGMGIYAAGLSERIETAFEEKLPFYRGSVSHRLVIWTAPDKGLLAGRITGIEEDNVLQLEDMSENRWKVFTEGALWRGRLSPAQGLEIKIIGTRTGRDTFRAKEIRPWAGKRKNTGKRQESLRGKNPGH
jgi:hypothetical protein